MLRSTGLANRITLIALHGYSLNGAQMKAAMGPLVDTLSESVDIVYPDGPHTCDAASVERMYKQWQLPRLPPPHLSWWDATDDGRIYRGWEVASTQLAALMEKHQPAALFGFSQGAILAAILAALSARGELPKLQFAVIVAGSIPRAEALLPLFHTPIPLPSLHVWGERDPLASARAPLLSERFEPALRKTMLWPGPHVIPTRGPAAETIIEFVREKA